MTDERTSSNEIIALPIEDEPRGSVETTRGKLEPRPSRDELEPPTSREASLAASNDAQAARSLTKNAEEPHAAMNNALVHFIVLPTIFLTVALLGGVRVATETRAFVFLPPPLVALFLAALLMILLARARLLVLSKWLSSRLAPTENFANALTLVALFFASAQAFNAAIPERGLFRFLLAFFFLWTLWTNLFAATDAHRLLRSLAAQFGLAFIFKYLLLANFATTNESDWLKRLASSALEGATGGALAIESYAPATGYIAFFALLLFICGLALIYSSRPSAIPEMKFLNDDETEKDGR